jgi:hypothetical protein
MRRCTARAMPVRPSCLTCFGNRPPRAIRPRRLRSGPVRRRIFAESHCMHARTAIRAGRQFRLPPSACRITWLISGSVVGGIGLQAFSDTLEQIGWSTARPSAMLPSLIHR